MWITDPRAVSPALPFRAAHFWAWLQQSWLQKGLGWVQSCQQGPGALGPGEAAHLAVASAWLVHEGAVLTGPHSSRGGMCGAPDGSVLMEARKLNSDCAAQLLDGGPLLGLLPCLSKLLISGPHGLQQQADAVLQRHDFIGDQKEQEVEIRDCVQEHR